MRSSVPFPRGIVPKGGFLRLTSLVLVAGVFLGSLAGCYGRFPLTSAIHKWNGKVTNNHIVNSIIMVVLGFFLPVYGLAILIDALIINSIEYWSGEPIGMAKTYESPDGTRVVLAPGSHEDEAILSVYRDERLVEQRTFLRQEDGTTHILDADGRLVTVVSPDQVGGFAFTDANGARLGKLTAAEIETIASRVN